MLKQTRHPKRTFARNAVYAAVAACFHPAALANPTGPQVAVGQATFNAQGPLLNVVNTPGAVINWQRFSIGAGETTRFVQQNAQSAVLNRVVTPDPSVLLGTLTSNGRVFLINPAGILVGAGARVDVAGFVASTLNLSNEDFAAGRLRFQAVPNAGSVVNEGTITSPEGGQVYLVAPTVTNSGTIATPKGETLLAAGNKVELVDTATPGVRVEIEVPGGAAQNLGRIVADSGRIGIVGALVQNRGQLNADQVVGDGHGRIFLKASKSVDLDGPSSVSAKGASGGSVQIQAGIDGDPAATSTVAGSIDVSGSSGHGGTATILAPHVVIADGTSIQASGAIGGGTVLLGGDYQGRNPDVPNATTTYVAPSALVNADATVAGDGGKIITWSNDATRMYGTFSARGGRDGGNGGFVEVSSHRYLDFTGVVNTLAPRGAAGMLLLDPDDVEIVDDGFDTSSTKISSSTVGTQLLGGNVTLTTSEGSNSGNIKINHTLALNSPNSLTMLAANNLDVTAAVSSSGSGSLKLVAGWNGSSTSSPAVTSGTGLLTVNNGGSINFAGGGITLLAGQGITVNGGTNVLKTTGGNINLQVSGSGGVSLSPSATSSSIDAGSGQISITAGSGGTKITQNAMTLASTNSTLGVSMDKLDVSGGQVNVNGIASVTTATVRGATSVFNGDATITSLSLTSGTVNGASTNGVTVKDTTGSLTWSGGTVLGKLTLGSGATGALSGSKTLGSSTIASRFTNKGTITDTSSEVSSRITLNSTQGASTVFDNQGSYTTGSSFGYSFLDGGQGGSVTNSGTFDVGSATYSIASGIATTNSGTVNVSGGSLSTGNFTNSGLLKLSGSSATDALAVNGNLNLTSTSTIRSTIVGTQTSSYGHIGVTGTADLQGKVQFVNGDYAPHLNDTFTIASYASRTSNQFSRVEALFGATFTPTYGTSSATAAITSLGGGVNAWLTFGDGSWTNSSNWSFGHLPTSTEDVEIASAVGTATLGSGTQTVNSLQSDANLTVSGGTLSLASTSKVNGTLTVSGGAVSGAGNLTVKNLTLSSGAVGGTGTLTVSDSYSRTGGTVSSTLTGLTVTQASGTLTPGSINVNGPVSLTASSGALSLDTISATTIFGKASGAVTINSGATLTATGSGNALTLVDGSSFVNNAGASALSASNGRWLVYSQDPSQDTRGGLAYGFKHYGQSYGLASYTGPGSGNGFLYAVTPTLTTSLTGTVSKTYDGTATATMSASNFATAGLIDGDSATYTTSSASYSDKNAGNGKTVTAAVSIAASNGGASVYGYTPTATTLSGAIGKIDKATLAVNGVAAVDKVYDGTITATLSGGTLSSVLSGDSVTLGTGAATFANKNVGSGKAVTVSSFAMGGADASNYQLTLPTGLTANITAAPLTLTGVTAANKVYDATTSASLSGGTLAGVVSGDSVTLGASSASFSDKNVGTAKPVTVASLALGGSDASNYALTLPSGLTANITQAPLSVTGVIAKSKVYDATATATLDTAGAALSGVMSSDNVTLGSSSASFADKKVGNGKPVTVASLALGGSDAANYSFTLPSGLTADITPAPLTISGLAAAGKTYDGTTTAPLSGGTLTGVLGSDVVGLSATGAFGDANVGTAKPITLAIGLTGTDAGNYSITQPSGTLAADISARALSTWTGSAGGLWSSSANWADGVVPVGSNVLAVSLPGTAGAAVTYDAAAGNTTLKTLTGTQNLVLAGGALTLGGAATDVSTLSGSAALTVQSGASLVAQGALTTPAYAQSGGTVTGTGSMTVSSQFSQTGGSIALTGTGSAAITQSSGNLTIASLAAPTVHLTAQSGAITQTGALAAGALVASATGGITLTDAGNKLASFSATNGSIGNVSLVNTGALTIAGITNLGGNVSVDNTGAVITSGTVSAPNGSVAIAAHSPLTVGTGGISAGGGVTLTAGQSASSGDDLTLSGPVESTGSGSAIVLTAGDNFNQDAKVTSNGGAVNASATSGSITMGLGGSTVTGGGNASYSAPSGNIVLTSIDAGSGAIDLASGGNTTSASGYTGTNLVAARAVIRTGGNATLATQVQSLEADVAGAFSITDAKTGQVLSGGKASESATEPVEQTVVATVNSSVVTATTAKTTAGSTTTGSSTAAAASTTATTVASVGPSTSTLPTKTDPNGTIGGGANEFGGSSSASGSSGSSSEGKDNGAKPAEERKQTAQRTDKQNEAKNASKKAPVCR